jgi:IS30 family transposase
MTKSNHKYIQLTTIERIKIETLANAGKNTTQIAQMLKRSPSTILREIRKGKSAKHNGQYKHHIAQKRTDARRGRKPSVADNSALMQDIVETALESKDYSAQAGAYKNGKEPVADASTVSELRRGEKRGAHGNVRSLSKRSADEMTIIQTLWNTPSRQPHTN